MDYNIERGKTMKRIMILMLMILLVIPLTSSFNGTGDGYELELGITGYGADTGSNTDYNMSFGLYDQPTGNDTNSIWDIFLGFFWASGEGEEDAEEISYPNCNGQPQGVAPTNGIMI